MLIARDTLVVQHISTFDSITRCPFVTFMEYHLSTHYIIPPTYTSDMQDMLDPPNQTHTTYLWNDGIPHRVEAICTHFRIVVYMTIRKSCLDEHFPTFWRHDINNSQFSGEPFNADHIQMKRLIRFNIDKSQHSNSTG